MKKKNLFAFMILMIFQSISLAWITDVNIVPANPSSMDAITFKIFGKEGNAPSWVESEEYSQDGTSLQLDLQIGMEFFAATSYWSSSKQIGNLELGAYMLTVREFYIDFPSYSPDIRTVEFTVTPEPATLIFLTIGLPVFRAVTKA